jgi:hypothetical protein
MPQRKLSPQPFTPTSTQSDTNLMERALSSRRRTGKLLTVMEDTSEDKQNAIWIVIHQPDEEDVSKISKQLESIDRFLYHSSSLPAEPALSKTNDLRSMLFPVSKSKEFGKPSSSGGNHQLQRRMTANT